MGWYYLFGFVHNYKNVLYLSNVILCKTNNYITMQYFLIAMHRFDSF